VFLQLRAAALLWRSFPPKAPVDVGQLGEEAGGGWRRWAGSEWAVESRPVPSSLSAAGCMGKEVADVAMDEHNMQEAQDRTQHKVTDFFTNKKVRTVREVKPKAVGGVSGGRERKRAPAKVQVQEEEDAEKFGEYASSNAGV